MANKHEVFAILEDEGQSVDEFIRLFGEQDQYSDILVETWIASSCCIQ